MIIVISPEQNIAKETLWVNRLFEAGLGCYHIRKPGFKDAEIANYLKEIDEQYHSRIAIHDRPQIALYFGIKRFHCSESVRLRTNSEKIVGYTNSTSVHDIETFNLLDNKYDYAFISPIYPSISKRGYGEQNSVLNEIKLRSNFKTKLIGLGGITPHNIKESFGLGLDGVALLGSIWHSENPLNIFKLCND